MSDHDIRQALRAELSREHEHNACAVVLEELSVSRGAARIDIVAVNRYLHGYEIKSNRDSLRRLQDQITAFSGVMERMTLVVGYRHAYDALQMVPEWWGVKLAEESDTGGAVLLATARAARENPAIDLVAAAGLLWRDETLHILNGIGVATGMSSKTRTTICRRLAEACDKEYLLARIRQQLKCRKASTAVGRQMSGGD